MTSRTFSRGRNCALACALLGLLAFPAGASADELCVDVVGGFCDQNYVGAAGFTTALNDAEANGDADTIRLGTATYNTPDLNGFGYLGTDPLTIDGSGEAATNIVMVPPGVPPGAPQTFLGIDLIANPAMVTLSDFTVTMPTPPDAPLNDNQSYRAIDIDGAAEIQDVTVQGPSGVGINGFGIVLRSGTVSDVTIDLPQVGNPGLQGVTASATVSQNLTIEDSQIAADAPVDYGNSGTGELLVRRSTLMPGPGYPGLSAKVADATIENSVIDLGGLGGNIGVDVGFSNPAAQTSSASLDGITIAGGVPGTRGVRAFTDPSGGADTVTATIRNTVIDDSVDIPIARQADNGGSANVTTSYSNYDSAGNISTNGMTGTGSLTETNGPTNLAPMFVGGGDYHLLAGSPLIDLGDPAAPAPGTLDLDGDARVIMGKAGCGPRRDIGADEVVPAVAPALLDCAAPDTGVTGRKKVKSKKKRARVSFTLTSTEAGSSFQCSLDGGPFATCSSPLFMKVRRGSHTLTVRATDGSGNQDTTPAEFAFKVKKKKLPKK
jgi:hypothetical protein